MMLNDTRTHVQSNQLESLQLKNKEPEVNIQREDA
jgi:hypothetical protein